LKVDASISYRMIPAAKAHNILQDKKVYQVAKIFPEIACSY
jgi:hypothetical protein